MKRTCCISLLGILTAVSLFLSGCVYFYPRETSIQGPSLVPSQRMMIPTTPVREGSVRLFYEITGIFTIDITKSSDIEVQIPGTIEAIHAFRGKKVQEGDLLVELNTDNIDEQLFLEDIELQKILVQYRSTQERYSAGQADRFDLEFMEIILQRQRNLISDLKERRKLHFLYAPQDGTVFEVYKTPGSSAMGLAMTLCAKEDGVAQITIVIPEVNYVLTETEQQISMLRPGREVVIEFRGVEYPAQILRDNFLFVSEVSLEPARDIFIHAQFRQIPEDIQFGSRVTVRYIRGEAQDVLVIPASCVFFEGDRSYVYIVENGEILRRDIQVGISDGVFYEVREGLSLGEHILLSR